MGQVDYSTGSSLMQVKVAALRQLWKLLWDATANGNQPLVSQTVRNASATTAVSDPAMRRYLSTLLEGPTPFFEVQDEQGGKRVSR